VFFSRVCALSVGALARPRPGVSALRQRVRAWLPIGVHTREAAAKDSNPEHLAQFLRQPHCPAPHPTRGRLRRLEIDALVDRYHAGDTINHLAERFRINPTTVIAHLNRQSVERRAVARQWDDNTLASAARTYADGSSLADIAAHFGLGPSTVANRFRRSGVPIPPRQGWNYAIADAVSEVVSESGTA